jgi:hypothetical protein
MSSQSHPVGLDHSAKPVVTNLLDENYFGGFLGRRRFNSSLFVGIRPLCGQGVDVTKAVSCAEVEGLDFATILLA